MSLEDRLYALAEEARQQHGAAFLRSPELLIPPLTTQAPDLHAEIRVLAHLLRDDVVAKIAAAADPVAEENRLAAEIATRERLSIVAFAPAIAVARRLGQIPAAAAAAAAPAAPAGGDWAGDSVVAGGPAPAYAPGPAAAPAGAPAAAPFALPFGLTSAKIQELMKNKWVLGGAAALVLLVGYQMMNKPAQQPPGQVNVPVAPGGQGPAAGPGGPAGPATGPGGGPAPATGPAAGGPPAGAPPGAGAPGNGGGGHMPPALGPPNGQLPVLTTQRTNDGSIALFFTLPVASGPAVGMVMTPGGGWDAGQGRVGFMRPGSNQLDTLGMGAAQRVNSQAAPVRVIQPQWQQDAIGVGAICIAFIGQQGQQDVSVQGSTMCVMDSQCNQPTACGRVQ